MPRAIRNVKGAILKTLAESEKKLTWLEILEKTQLSKGALSKHLNELIEDGVVKTSTVNTRPPTTLYNLVEPQPSHELPEIFRGLEGYNKLVFAATASAFQTGIAISQLEDRDLARYVLKGYLNSNLRWIMGVVLYVMPLACAYSKGFEQGAKNTRLGRLLVRKKRYDVYVEEVRKRTRNLVEPWIEALANTVFVNSDIASDAEGVAFEVGRDLSEQVNVDWFDVLEKNPK